MEFILERGAEKDAAREDLLVELDGLAQKTRELEERWSIFTAVRLVLAGVTIGMSALTVLSGADDPFLQGVIWLILIGLFPQIYSVERFNDAVDDLAKKTRRATVYMFARQGHLYFRTNFVAAQLIINTTFFVGLVTSALIAGSSRVSALIDEYNQVNTTNATGS